MTRRKKAVFVALLLFLGIQLVPVPRENPEAVAPISVPDDVRVVLENSCNDCHEDKPASWAAERSTAHRRVLKKRSQLTFGPALKIVNRLIKRTRGNPCPST